MAQLIDATLQIMTEVATGLIDNLPMLLEAAFELAKALADALLHYDWWSLAKKIFESIKGSLKTIFTGESGSSSGDTRTNPRSRNAGGLEYVPFDNYDAILHRGERVLTAQENARYEQQPDITASEVRALRNEIRDMRDSIRRYGITANVGNWRQGRRELRTT